MGAGITPGPARQDAGVTLIELLIVVAVLSVLTVGVGLSTGRGAGSGTSDAAGFRQSFETMRSLAVHGREKRGLVLTERSLQTARLVAGEWQVAGTGRSWRGRAAYRVEGPRARPETPNIVFLANGQTSAFQVTFTGGGSGRAIRCASDGWTGLTCDAG